MREIEIDFDDTDFLDVMINELEKEYGRSVARIAKLKAISLYSFEVIVVFSDFRLLEAEVIVQDYGFMPSVHIRGNYY
jgi:hypothetical protein